MGLYAWLSKEEFTKYSEVSNVELNELFQEVRELFPQLYISERTHTVKGWFKKTKIVTTYTLYTRQRKSDNMVKCLNIKSSNEDYVSNFLYGVLNGKQWRVKRKPKPKTK